MRGDLQMALFSKSLERERIEATPRKNFTKKQRAEAFLRANGRCEMCGEKIVGTFDIDHRIALHHGGAHDPSNWQIACRPCHVDKTRADVKASAKIKRIIKADTEPKKPSRIKSAGFSRTHSRGFDGKVRPKKKPRHD
jgi:5-methylcytosine-specific restriction endonuclease McrA